MGAVLCPANSKIYVFCPGGYATGGPEALHQLAHHLNKLGFEAYMHYYSTPAGQNGLHENYIKYQVPVVDTTGAGDIFHAGFLYGLLQGWPLQRQLDFACAAAAMNCTGEGARGGIGPVEKIETMMRETERYARPESLPVVDEA